MINKSNLFSNSSEMLMIAFAIGILFILFIPIPAVFLDLLLIVNFSWALTILLLTFYIDKPLSFSIFPALLLISTLFRLALNISATRLILSDGDAGKIILAMGQYVIHGNIEINLNQVEEMLGERKRPILLCSSLLRRHIKQLTQRVIPHLNVLAMNEIPINVQVESFGIVK